MPLLWKRLDWHCLFFALGVEEGRMLWPLTPGHSVVASRDMLQGILEVLFLLFFIRAE